MREPFSYKIQTSDGIKKDPGVAQYKCAMSLYPAAQLKTSRKKSNENNDKNAQFCDANPHQNLIKWIHIIDNSNAIRKTHEK